jgi:hypothetical protein
MPYKIGYRPRGIPGIGVSYSERNSAIEAWQLLTALEASDEMVVSIDAPREGRIDREFLRVLANG